MIPRVILGVLCISIVCRSSFAQNTIPIEGPCSTPDECVGDDRSECAAGFCKCLADFVPRSDNTDCLPIRNRLGDQCEQADQCTLGEPGPHSNCLAFEEDPSQLVCQCTEEAVSVPYDEQCYKKATSLNEICVKTQQCEANLGRSSCVFQGILFRCKCNAGAAFNDIKCVNPGEKMLIGEKCIKQEHCVGDVGTSSICLTEKCACRDNHVASRKRDDCLLQADEVSKPCLEDQQCTEGTPGEFSECVFQNAGDTFGSCLCTSDAVFEIPENKCREKAKLIGDKCDIPSQCVDIPNSECNNAAQECECIDNFVPSPDKTQCSQKKFLGEACVDEYECGHVANAYCMPIEDGTKTCQCASLYVNPVGSTTECFLAATEIEQPCNEHDSQCSRLEGAICDTSGSPKTCICDSTTHVQHPTSKKCLEKAKMLNEKCEDGSQCADLPNSACAQSVVSNRLECLCKDTFVESLKKNPRRECLPIGDKIDDYCDEDVQCTSGKQGELSECDESSHKCKCIGDAVPDQAGETCYPKVSLIGSRCDISEQCKDIEGGAECSRTTLLCTCIDANDVPSHNFDKCLKKIDLENECEQNDQCTDFSECVMDDTGIKGKCTCIRGYVGSKHAPTKCVKIVNNLDGDKCDENVQCTAGTPGDHSHCELPQGVCKCNPGAGSIPGTDRCGVPPDMLGSPCSSPTDCARVPHATCLLTPGGTGGEKTCQCKEHFISPPNAFDACYKIASKLGEPCAGTDSQCSLLTNATCDQNQFCNCNDATHVPHASDLSCLPVTNLLGDGCSQDNQCKVLHSECNMSRMECACKISSDFIESDEHPRRACVKIQNELGKECKEDKQCQQGTPGELSECNDSDKCDCKSDAVEVENKCYKVAELIGDSCEKNEQCKDIGASKSSECVSHKCVCPDHYVPNHDNTDCLEMEDSLGGTCVEDEECQTPNSICGTTKTCICNDTFVQSGGSCLPIVNQLNETCKVDIQCSRGIPGAHSKCSEGKECSCKDIAVHAEGKHHCYKRTTKVGKDCEVEEQCGGIEKATCDSQKCTCIPGHEPSLLGDKCLEKVTALNESCVEPGQCKVEHSWCKLSLESGRMECLCDRDHVESLVHQGSVCLQIVNSVGGGCEEDIQCTAGKPGELSQCKGLNHHKVCSCVEGAVVDPAENECLPKAQLIGDECKIPDQCGDLDHTSCNGGTCTCEPGFVSSDASDKCLKVVNSLDDPCEETRQCRIGHSTCDVAGDGERRCLCAKGTYVESLDSPNTCVAVINDLGLTKCNENIQCEAGTPGKLSKCFGSGTDKVCTCSDGAVNIPGHHHCLAVGMLGSPCKDDAQCESGVTNSACVATSPDGATTTCQCISTHIPPPGANDQCNKIAEKLGEPCEHHLSQCSLLGDSVCEGTPTVCTCTTATHVPDENGLKCLSKSGGVGGPCEQHDQCQVTHSKCDIGGGKCICQRGFIESESFPGKRCLKIINELENAAGACQESVQCRQGLPGNFSECAGGTCKCTEGAAHPSWEHKCFKKSALIGDPCEFDEQCGGIEGAGSECIGGTCACNDNSIPSANKRKCLDKLYSLHMGCSEGSQCQMRNSSCAPAGDGRGMECLCDSTFVESAILPESCVLIINQLEQSCSEDVQCQTGVPGDLSECNEEKKCHCNSKSLHVEGEHHCYPKPTRVGGVCTVEEQCQAVEGTHCVAERCVCADDHFPHTPANDKCLKNVHVLNETCEEASQCKVGNSDCILSLEGDGRMACLCQADHVESELHPGIACVEIAGQLGTGCTEDVQCSAGPPGELSECRGSPKQCHCVETAVPDSANEQCFLKASLIRDKCDIKEQCQHMEGSGCIDGHCACELGYVASESLDRCLKVKTSLNQPCEESSQCRVGHSECLVGSSGSGKCSCIKGVFVESEDTPGTCVEVVNELNGPPCSEPVQCVSGEPGELSDCLDNVCQCKGDATNIDGQHHCLAKGEIGAPCEDSAQCSVDNSACMGTSSGGSLTCQCLPSYVPPPNAKDKCNKVAEKLGDDCSEQNQCGKLEYAVCGAGGHCVCSAKSHVPNGNGTKCLELREHLGEGCEQNNQCQVGHSQCGGAGSGGECTCESGYIESELHPKKQCLQIINELGGKTCREDIQCQQGLPGDFSECSGGTCGCISPAVPGGNNKCLEKVELIGEPCEVNEQCVVGSACVSKTCQCQPNTIPSPDLRECLGLAGSLNQTCTQNDQCLVPNSECARGSRGFMQCLCIKNTFVESWLSFGSCVPVINELEASCSEDVQCQTGVPGESSECGKEKQCKCKPGAISLPGKHHCYEEVPSIGAPCSADEQCAVEGSHCVAGTCACDDDHVSNDNDDKCLKKIHGLNESCVESKQCQQDHSECARNPENGRKECLCTSPSYVESRSFPGTCVEVINELNGESCTEDVQCTAGIPGELSECADDHQCQCKSDAISAKGEHKCFQKASLVGDSCAKNEVQCESVKDSKCDDESKTCVCLPDVFVPSSNRTKCLERQPELDGLCEESVQCDVSHARCQDDGDGETRCLCEFNKYVASNMTDNTCVEIIGELNRICVEDAQCKAEPGMGAFSECRDYRCQCLQNYAYYSPTHHCYTPVHLNGVCSSVEECRVGISNYATCDDFARCSCLPGTIEKSNSCWAKKVVGESCSSDAECSVHIQGPVQCDSNYRTCSCKVGFKTDITGTHCSGANSLLGTSSLLVLLLTVINVVFK